MDDVYGLYMYALETWYLLLVQEEDTMSLEHTYRVHKDQTWSKSLKMKILTFSGLKDDLWDVKYYHH